MAYLINLPTFSDKRGSLTLIEKVLPFDIKRVYFIYDVKEKRGGHRHKKAIQALVCLNGSCEIYIENEEERYCEVLDSPKKCLIIQPQDWHTMDKFSEGSVLLVISSEYYDKEDYISERYT